MADENGVPGEGSNETMILNPAEIQQQVSAAEAKKNAVVISGTPRLIGQSDIVAGQQIELTKPKTTVGRSDQNDIVITDGTVSARHAQIVQEEGTWRVINLISTNGTAVNGKTNIVSYLAPGDLVSFGRVEMKFEADSSAGTKAVDGRLGGMASAGGGESSFNTKYIVAGVVAIAVIAVAAFLFL